MNPEAKVHNPPTPCSIDPIDPSSLTGLVRSTCKTATRTVREIALERAFTISWKIARSSHSACACACHGFLVKTIIVLWYWWPKPFRPIVRIGPLASESGPGVGQLILFEGSAMLWLNHARVWLTHSFDFFSST